MITSLYAALLGLMFVALTFYVIHGRTTMKLSLGDGGNEAMRRRIRIQANFTETVPIALILMLLAETGGTGTGMLHILGGLLLAGRILHVYGLWSPQTPMAARVGGMMMTLISVLGGAGVCLMNYLG